MRVFIISTLSLCLMATIAARNITFDDLYSVPRYGDIQISPDGASLVFVMTTRDPVAGSSESHIWNLYDNRADPIQLTGGEKSAQHPRWSPDSQWIFYLRDDDSGTTQIWRTDQNASESKQVTSLSTGVSSFQFFPSGDKLLIVSRVFPDCHDDSCNQAQQQEKDDNPIKARIFDKLLYRHYNRWDDGKVNRILVYDLNSGTCHEVYGAPDDVPTALLGGSGDCAISPDGEEICFAMNTSDNPAVRVNNELFVISSGGGDPVRITDNGGLDQSPQYSPDGRYIAYLSMARAGYESDQQDLVLYDRDEGRHINLTTGFDRSIGEFQWGPESKFIYFSAIEHGLSKIYRIEIATDKVETLLDTAVYGDFQVSPDGKFMIVSRSRSDQPYELYRYAIESEMLAQLTAYTEKITGDLDMNPAEDFWFIGALDDSIHGWLTLPPGFDSTQKYPLVLLIHGGPQWCWLGDFNYYGWNTQLMAAQGYVVAQIDPHGSVGYGIKFKEYVSGNWGKGDYQDLMKGVDYLIESHSFIDSTRMAALGRSYGGFMTNWICGHTDRFKCLVTIDGTYNHLSGYGSTEELWFPEWEYKGTPYDNWEEYIRSSPVTYAKNFKTPTMVIHGQRDYRVDLSEGLQMFTALQRQGVPSQLLYLPDEGHNAGKLQNLRFIYEKQFEWLKRWLVP